MQSKLFATFCTTIAYFTGVLTVCLLAAAARHYLTGAIPLGGSALETIAFGAPVSVPAMAVFLTLTRGKLAL